MQVVQNIRIIPEVLHPRCRLPEPVAAGVVGEVVYIPVYDLQAPHAGPVAVLEALLSATATDSMLVANFISVAGNVLSCLQVRGYCCLCVQPLQLLPVQWLARLLAAGLQGASQPRKLLALHSLHSLIEWLTHCALSLHALCPMRDRDATNV